MPSLQEIVDVNITLESSAISVRGFNSLLLAGKAQSFVAGQPASFAVGEVRPYTTLEQVQADAGIAAEGEIMKMASVAFAQSPSMSTLYIAYAKDTTADADEQIETQDLLDIMATNNDWFGFCSEFNDPLSIKRQNDALGETKYGFYLIEDAVDSIPAGLDALSDYSSLWHTKSTDTEGGKYVNVAVASALLALKPGSYTAAFKTLQAVSTSTYSPAEELLLRPTATQGITHRINQYSPVSGRSITWEGVTANVGTKGFIDTYIGKIYLQARLEEDIFAQLASVGKIPYTNAGAQVITTAIMSRLNESVRDGYLKAVPAPVVAPVRIDEIPPTSVSARVLPDIKFTAETAGAVHTVKINGSISV